VSKERGDTVGWSRRDVLNSFGDGRIQMRMIARSWCRTGVEMER
jgi:hypothetical protein